MTDKLATVQTGSDLFETFVEQIKQALEHLYDFAYLQQHELARFYDPAGDLSAKTAGRQLRYELITAIESLHSKADSQFRAPEARLYNLLHLIYVESLTIQAAALELGLSERQTYRDLKRGHEAVAAVLWTSRLPIVASPPEFSVQSEVAHLKLNFSLIDITAVFQQACQAVERLALLHAVTLTTETGRSPLMLMTDSPLAHQVMVSVLSYAIQQAQLGVLTAVLDTQSSAAALIIRYAAKRDINAASAAPDTQAPLYELAQRLHWSITIQDSGERREIRVQLLSHSVTVLVIDDNEGWVALLERFLAGHHCTVVTPDGGQDILSFTVKLRPNAIILDVMMPDTDGWEILQRLRAQPATAHTPIIICSVFNDPQLAYSLGASAFISKSTNLDKIAESLRSLSII